MHKFALPDLESFCWEMGTEGAKVNDKPKKCEERAVLPQEGAAVYILTLRHLHSLILVTITKLRNLVLMTSDQLLPISVFLRWDCIPDQGYIGGS